MKKTILIENITDDHDQETLNISIGKYKLFLAKVDEGSIDAMVLYNHLQFTTILQRTNSIKATDSYLKSGLGWGETKLKRAKTFLHKYKLISYKQDRRPDGTMGNKYIIVNTSLKHKYSFSENPETALPDNHPTGDEKQMLLKQNKCLSEKVKDILDHWNSHRLITHSENACARNIKQKHIEIIDDFGSEIIKIAIGLYDYILHSENHYWTYKWTLWDFLIRGIDRFVPDADPLKTYKIMSKPNIKSFRERNPFLDNLPDEIKYNLTNDNIGGLLNES